jgi:thioredoxin reductase (NADPH)
METNVPGLFVAGTAAAGTQIHFRLFIENCHTHVVRILRKLTGKDPEHVNRLAYQQLDEDPLVAES